MPSTWLVGTTGTPAVRSIWPTTPIIPSSAQSASGSPVSFSTGRTARRCPVSGGGFGARVRKPATRAATTIATKAQRNHLRSSGTRGAGTGAGAPAGSGAGAMSGTIAGADEACTVSTSATKR